MGVWYLFAAILAVLQTLLIGAMQSRRAWRDYPLIFFYALTLLLSNVVEWASVLGFGLSRNQAYATYYWSNEVILQFFLFCIMIALIHQAARGARARWILTLGMGAAVIVVCGLLVLLSTQGAPGSLTRWMTVLSRNLSFCSALLNLVLWTILLRRRIRDIQLLLLSAGLGLQTTGKAIGHSLRRMSPDVVGVGNWIIVLSMIVCLLVWWYAFRIRRVEPAADGALAHSHAA